MYLNRQPMDVQVLLSLYGVKLGWEQGNICKIIEELRRKGLIGASGTLPEAGRAAAEMILSIKDDD